MIGSIKGAVQWESESKFSKRCELLSLTVPYCLLLSPYHPPLQHKTYPECLVRTTRYSSTRLTLASTVASKSKVTTRIKTQTVKLSTSVGTMALAP